MGPVARMGSVLTLTIAAGALLILANSSMINDPVLDPLPKGNTNTLPATLWLNKSCRGSLIRPVAGSTPPQKLIDCEVFSTFPFPIPGTTQHPFIFFSKVIPSCRFFHEPRFQRSLQYRQKPHPDLFGKNNNWQT